MTACGYTTQSSGVRTIDVQPIQEQGADLDTGALVEGAIRRHVQRHPGLELERTGAEAVLHVQLVRDQAQLAPFADPGLRAAQYVARVSVVGRLIESDGRLSWRSPVVTGEAPYLSVPDDLVALDGARRRAMARAAEDAAEQLVALMVYASKRPAH